MTRQYKVSFFAFLFSLWFFFPQVAHGRLAVHHIHRPLPLHKQHIHRQLNPAALVSGLGNIIPSIIGQSSDGGGTSSPPPTSTAPDSSAATTAPAATTTPSSSDPLNAASPFSVQSPSSPSSSPPQTSDPPPSSPASSSSPPPSTSNPPSSPPTSDFSSTPSPANSTPQSSQPPSSPSTSSSPTPICPLGVDLLGQCIVPSTSNDVQPTSIPPSQSQTPSSLISSSGTPALPISSNNPISLPPLSSNAPTSSVPPPSNTPASSPPPSSDAPTSPLSSNTPVSSPPPSSDAPALPLSSNTPVSSPPSLSDTPTSSAPPPLLNTPVSSPPPSLSNAPISLSPTPSIPISLPPLSLNTPNSSPPPSASSPAANSANSPSPSATPQNTQTALTSSPSPDNQPSSPSPALSSSAPIDSPTSVFIPPSVPPSGSVLRQSVTSFPTSQLPSSSPGFDSRSQSPPVSTLGPSNSGASSSSGLSPSAPISSQGGTSSIPGSLSQSASGTAAEPSTTFGGTNSASVSASSSPPVISFPSDTTGPNDLTTSAQSASTGSSTPSFTQNSQFSFITVSSLLGTSFQSSSIPPTLTNPDAPTTTLSLPDASTSAAGPVSSAPLPTDLPSRIYPADVVNPSALPSGDVLCSLLFTSFLPWNFVSTSTQSQGQLFSWTPIIISQALNISSTDTPPFALQVFVPDSYQGPQDAEKLRTEYLFFLPSQLVSVLANEIKVQSSPFYNIAEPYRDLAVQVDPAFALTSVPNPNAVPGTSSSASSGGNKSRTATIIGVVSALGGLALIILGTLIFNGVKRSRQLRHQRLSDPNLPNDPYPDRTGRDFDQDSVGGPRRRSFYFAEDSLRGQPQTAEQSTAPIAQAQTQHVVQPGSQIQYSSRSSPENIRERRAPVVPGAISAPILTQSSLNW